MTGRAHTQLDAYIERDAVTGILAEIGEHNRRGGWRRLQR